MAVNALHEHRWSLDDTVHEMPNAISRWDSHETSPVPVNGAEMPKQQQQQQQQQVLPIVANEPQRHLPSRAHGRMSNRRQITALHVPHEGTAGPMPFNNNEGDEGESCDEEIMSSDGALTYIHHQDEPEQVHILEAAMPFLSQSATPSKNLLIGQNGEDVQEIGQWYFVCQLPERDAEFFKSVQNNWVRDIWDMGRNSQSIFSVLGAFALHKKATLAETHAKTEYYEQKGQIIQNIVSDIKRSPDNGIDPMTVVAMAILAYFDIRDDQFDAAGTHLRAVRNFIDMEKLPPQGWLYCSWTDLRQALFTETEPQLPFYVPHVFREVHPALRFQQREAFRVGALNASQCPRSAIFTLDMSSDLFGKLHALCYCSDVLAPTETPPFGQVYALEYGLRVVQARAKRSAGDVFTSPIILITSAIQLHVWMASRFYTPQARETHLSLTRVASAVIDGFDDMITQWYITAGLESLLWVLFTLVASFRAHELPQTTRTLALLYQALRKAGINSCDGLEARLKKWPWLHNWHPVQIGVVWEMLCARYPDLVPRISRPDIPEAQSDPNKARHRWFLGGLEFYNSL
jgi:hypothetical protein